MFLGCVVAERPSGKIIGSILSSPYFCARRGDPVVCLDCIFAEGPSDKSTVAIDAVHQLHKVCGRAVVQWLACFGVATGNSLFSRPVRLPFKGLPLLPHRDESQKWVHPLFYCRGRSWKRDWLLNMPLTVTTLQMLGGHNKAKEGYDPVLAPKTSP